MQIAQFDAEDLARAIWHAANREPYEEGIVSSEWHGLSYDQLPDCVVDRLLFDVEAALEWIEDANYVYIQDTD